MSNIRLERWIARKLRLRHVELIAEVYDSRSIVKASRRLNLTQPAVTKAVQDIEQTLGLALFERTNRGLIPSLFGEIFARHCKIVLAQLRHAAEELENLRVGYSGHVYVGTLLAASASLLPEAIALLKAERPGVAITVLDGTYDVLLPALMVGDIHMVLGRLPEIQNDAFGYEEFYAEPTCLVTRRDHPLTHRPDVQLEDLVDHPWLLPLPETALRRQMDKEFSEHKVSPKNVIESMSVLNNRALLRISDCIGVMPYHVALDDVDSGLLSILPIKLRSTGSNVGAITAARGGDLPPAANAMLQCLRCVGREIAAELQGGERRPQRIRRGVPESA